MTIQLRSGTRRAPTLALAVCSALLSAACAEEKASIDISTAAAMPGDARAAAADAGSGASGRGMDASSAMASSGVQVTVANGKLQGKMAGGVRAFLGIPYAKPPVGELRFMPPEPAEDWKGVRKATEFGPSCVQNASALSAMGAQDEDCLTLNVFTPAKGDGHAVMVWIHGGAFVSGGSSQYDGTKLASEKGVIVVTLNYRLGALGFLSHPELDGDAHGGVPSGNDALRDQQLALTWVRDNIAEFGGDPKKVTVIGESAGSASTCIHAVSPTGKTLGARYILESGSCYGSFLMSSKAAADAIGTELAEALCEGEADLLACLREKDAQEIVAWGADRGISGAGWTPVINADDELLPRRPAEIIADGEHTDGELLLGTNKNEWALFVQLQMTDASTLEKLNAAIDAQFPEPLNMAIKAHYVEGATDATAAATLVRLVTDGFFRCPTRGLARAFSERGNDVFLYSFEFGPAFHAYEIPFVFGNPSVPLGITDVEPMRPVMQTYWTQFAKTGSPNGGDQPEWPAYDAEGDQHMTLTPTPEAGSGLSAADCDFWDEVARASM